MLGYFSLLDNDSAKFTHNALVRMEICFGLGRFFGEAWIGSASSLLAADCLPEQANTNFIMYVCMNDSMYDSLVVTFLVKLDLNTVVKDFLVFTHECMMYVCMYVCMYQNYCVIMHYAFLARSTRS